ncbi:MAG: acyl-CoA thioesterase [Anaerolineae bacterium]|nr:acyl-CoA thioesterase [Anaerolineae bacterium]
MSDSVETAAEGKTIEQSRIHLSQLMGPQDANHVGNVHGGVIMKMVDEAGALAAMRHAQSLCVTVAIDSMTFIEPIYVGYVVTVEASLTYAGKTSMEARVEVVAENPLTGDKSHTNTAYVVYVALDGQGKPRRIPPLLASNPEEEADMAEAQERQAYRKQQRQRESTRRIRLKR